MHRLTLSEFLITILLLIGALYLAGQCYQSWLQNLTVTTINSLPH